MTAAAIIDFEYIRVCLVHCISSLCDSKFSEERESIEKWYILPEGLGKWNFKSN